LFDDMLREDPEYTKLAAVKGLTDVTEFREKYGAGTEEFKAAMLKLADEKREERALYQTAVDTAKQEKDHAARQLIQAFEKRKKHAFRDVRDDPSRAEQVSRWSGLYCNAAYGVHCVRAASLPSASLCPSRL
jgi:hypothetical protein